ncbi:membrane metallo-endopeptidase-like 1 [Drosophila eugracilis]|uniref:membrane metallo-endopeptidase-like 1 n=1 Tax=Drosophila eugracilis TaxID=29029 RepID=UPI0007E7118D|nr:membrane metallo-endopeptidase-like 1 [Drosophila eugracilis]
MVTLSLVACLIFSLSWRTTLTTCRQTVASRSIKQSLAEQLLSYIDPKARPCENFYQYACGNWLQQHQQHHSPHHRHWARWVRGREHYQTQLLPSHTLGLIDHSVNKKLALLLRNRNESSYILEQMRLYYRYCKRLKPYNLKKYINLLPPTNCTQWSVGRGWSPERFDWISTLGRLRLHGLNGVLLREDVLPRWDDSRSYSIYVNKPSRHETLPMGQGAMIELLLDIGLTKRKANALARMVDDFERKLHRLQELEDDEGAHEMQLGYLDTYLPQLRWLSFMRQLSIDFDLDLHSTLFIENIPYLKALCKLVDEESPDTVCNYIMIKWLAFLKQEGPSDISRDGCIASLRRAMPLTSSWLVGQQFSDPESESNVRSLFQRLKGRFAQILAKNQMRLSQPILHILQQKLHAVRMQLGFFQSEEMEYVEQYNDRVNLSGHSFYANQLLLLRLRVEENHNLLSSNLTNSTRSSIRYLTESWEASNSSPLYIRPRNLLFIPYGLLQLPVWHRNITDLQRYAVMGFALAHEMAHGFDLSGMDYDAQGNIIGPVEEIGDNRQFQLGLNCLQQQMTTGSKWIDETLADYVALRLTYESFFDSRADTQKPSDLVKPQFSQRKLFFITFAQIFCGRTAVSTMTSQSEDHLKHAVDELRVMQTLANFDEFSKEFNCDTRHSVKMQFSPQCRLW